HLAPPLLAKRDPQTGEARKMEFGAWILPVFRVLAKLKGLRGTPLDIFGYTAERRTERQLIRDYRETIEGLLQGLTPRNYNVAIDIANIPEMIRGYGHVKEAHLRRAKEAEAALLLSFNKPAQPEQKRAA
ncbi:MAG TPA: DUF6537 domain-containing protein, partial [Patescibacteria group bacterium]|nr:DUF6537 domain-containing protein [Patescibacteria group bacterium]